LNRFDLPAGPSGRSTYTLPAPLLDTTNRLPAVSSPRFSGCSGSLLTVAPSRFCASHL
jgi:hypothetical protein